MIIGEGLFIPCGFGVDRPGGAKIKGGTSHRLHPIIRQRSLIHGHIMIGVDFKPGLMDRTPAIKIEIAVMH
ncbi:hypothetical protein JCM17846_19710 [Iodidimonas nitroreducens]|uniref:Uncharacterized protein n=1 Tax=Iodidimonas nitroreducens TaxID=1236968 RepID=A0A5A7NB72_9PROT|nr:hypothetical protein JCM17846_19710 [Iodidimonas nitroreducens]